MPLIKFLTFILWKFRKLKECCIRILGHPVYYAQMSYISMSGPSCKKMAFVMGLRLNKSPFPFPGFPALCAQGWVPIQSRRFCAFFLLEMWASEKRKAGKKQHSWTGCEHTRLLVPREATVIQLNRHLLNTKCALGSIYSQVLHREGTPGPLCELTHQVSVILSWGQQTASAGG